MGGRRGGEWERKRDGLEWGGEGRGREMGGRRRVGEEERWVEGGGKGNLSFDNRLRGFRPPFPLPPVGFRPNPSLLPLPSPSSPVLPFLVPFFHST